MEYIEERSLEGVKKSKSHKKVKGFIRWIALVVVSFIMVYPLIWMFSNSFKTAASILRNPISLLPDVMNLSNFSMALEMAPFDLYVFNSIFTASIIVIVQLFLSCLLAYGMSFYDFPGKKILFGGIIMTYMLPPAATYVPSYVILAKLHLLDSLAGIIVSNLANVFTIFLLIQTFRSVPKELVEAARIEGSTDRQILLKVVIPFTKSTLFTVTLINFVAMYNNYMWPSLITTSKSKMLISVGLNTFFTSQGNFTQNLPGLMAANSIAVIPLLVLFIVLQKWFIKGISDSGIKG
ncbi:MAG: carbohydrate ABC transporter permease [Tissierellia bacterium]|nr:carbohydrate ABC transporter permease [Tissierellia bacterium]